MKTENSTDEIERRFGEHRPRLRLLALRILGTVTEADDALQDTWLKVRRTDPQTIENWGRLADHRDLTGLPRPFADPQSPARIPGRLDG